VTDWTAKFAEHPLLVAVEAGAPRLRETLDLDVTSSVISDATVELLRATGVFRMTLPAALGGLQADPATQLRVVERLSEIDAALGWYANIGSDGGYYSSFLDESVAAAMYGPDPDAITAGFTDPAGVAVPVPEGYRVRGRWPFGSATRHSTWVASGCRVVASEDHPRHGRTIVAVLSRDDCVVDESSWRPLGLRGTGSFDYFADVVVPEARTFGWEDGPRRTDALYRCPTMYRCNAPGVPLGVARGALAEFAVQVLDRTDPRTGRPRREDHALQAVFGHATAVTDAARAYAYTTVDGLWQTLTAGGEPDRSARASFRLMLAQTADMCRDAVLELFRAAGGAAVYDRHPVQRRLRDVLTAGQHALANERSFAVAGAVLAGLPSDDPAL
jgi:alkylation response protein AidB-like acyl-CoA dehydrogenase